VSRSVSPFSSHVFRTVPKHVGACLAKNIALAGVKSVTLYDPEPVQVQDLGTQVSLRALGVLVATGYEMGSVVLFARVGCGQASGCGHSSSTGRA
jgi:hypothetical protein